MKSTRSFMTHTGLSLLIVATMLASVSMSYPPSIASAQASQVTPMLPGDRIVGPGRGSAAPTIAFAQRYGARSPADVTAYITEVYRLAPQLGFDPAIVVAQSALETDSWRSDYWANHRNPAGIGITFDGQSSFTWANGTDAARAQLVHLALYTTGELAGDHPLFPYIALDPRYQAAISAGYAGSVTTIADLTGRWATDPSYGEKLAGRGNDHLYRYRIAALTSSANATGAQLADDAQATTGWRSVGQTPDAAWLRADLGQLQPIGRIRWLLGAPGVTDRMRVEISLDGIAWAGLGEFGSGPTGQWQGISLANPPSARYVRWTVENPNGAPVLGTIAEVQLWPPATTAFPFLIDRIPPAPDDDATPLPPLDRPTIAPRSPRGPTAPGTDPSRPDAPATQPGRPNRNPATNTDRPDRAAPATRSLESPRSTETPAARAERTPPPRPDRS